MTWHPSNLFWSQFVADDLGFLQKARLHQHIQHCSHCAQQKGQLTAEKSRYTAQHRQMPASLSAAGAAPAPLTPWMPRLWTSIGLATCSAAVSLLMLRASPHSESLRPKGADTFVLFKQQGGASQRLDSRCAAGDALRANYHSSKAFLLVLEIDGAHHVQILLPAGGSGSTPIQAGSQLVSGSWVLDDTPGLERFVALFSEEPLEAEKAAAALLQGQVPRAAGLAMVEMRCMKE